ncbi:MAG: glycosyltransferase family 4 protein [Bryobacterales bacterium]
MRIAYITAGAGGTICGNCLRDNALATAMQKLGHEVLLLPVYTPIRTDEADVSAGSVYLGGVNIYLRQKSSLFRNLPAALSRQLDNPGFLRWVSQFAVKTLPEDLGALTLATAQGEDGPLRDEIQRLAGFLKGYRPDAIHLTNSMLAGLAPALKREVGVPVFCSLQGEDYYLEHLPAPFPEQVFEELRKQARAIDQMIAPCRAQALALGPRLGKDPEQIPVVLPGINVADFEPRGEEPGDPFTVGFLARLAPEKAPHSLLDALPTGERVRFAGWVSAEYEDYVAPIEKRAEVLRDIDRHTKIEFLRSLDVLSVPAIYGASKGLYVLEAWAAAVPVVQPRIGVYPELFEAAGGGGLLFEPGDVDELGALLEHLRTDPEQAREMGMAGYRAAHQLFTAERMARETVAIYEQLHA